MGLAGMSRTCPPIRIRRIPPGDCVAIDTYWGFNGTNEWHGSSNTFYSTEIGYGVWANWSYFVSAVRRSTGTGGVLGPATFLSKFKITGPASGTVFSWDDLTSATGEDAAGEPGH